MEKHQADIVRRLTGYMQVAIDADLVIEDVSRWFVKTTLFPGRICGCALGFAMAGKIGDPFKAYDTWSRGQTRRDSDVYDESLQNIASILDAPLELVREIENIHGNDCPVHQTIQRLEERYSLA